MKRVLILILLAVAAVQLDAQDLTQYKKVVKDLSSARFQGRGYARGGANKAGKYLEKEYRKAGVDAVTLQPFTIDINTFPGAKCSDRSRRTRHTGSAAVLRLPRTGASRHRSRSVRTVG